MVTPERLAKLQTISAKRQEGIIILEDIFDPHNAQAVFRTAEVFGFQRIALIFASQKAFDPKRIGKLSSSSANKWLDFMIYSSAEACFTDLKKLGYDIWGTVASPVVASETVQPAYREGSSRTKIEAPVEDIYSADLSARRMAMAFGNEHRGLSAEAQNLADHLITIPQAGWVESFNLSVAAAIFAYEITRQRMVLGIDKYLLDESQRTQLAAEFEER